MEIKIVNEAGQPVTEAVQEINSTGTTLVSDQSLVKQSIAAMFDLSPSEMSKNESKLDTLIAYAKTKTDDHSPESIKWALRSLQSMVGTPPLGESWIPYLTRYAFLNLEKTKIDKELTKFHNK